MTRRSECSYICIHGNLAGIARRIAIFKPAQALKTGVNMQDWIIVVDDDAANLKLANGVFREAGIRGSYF